MACSWGWALVMLTGGKTIYRIHSQVGEGAEAEESVSVDDSDFVSAQVSEWNNKSNKSSHTRNLKMFAFTACGVRWLMCLTGVTHSKRTEERPWKVSLSICWIRLCWKFLRREKCRRHYDANCEVGAQSKARKFIFFLHMVQVQRHNIEIIYNLALYNHHHTWK